MIRIITDSGSDIEVNEYENLIIQPLKVNIGDKTYLDGIDMSKNEFFVMLEESDVLPSTSLASPYEFEEIYKKVSDDNDEAIVLPISSGVSGTCQSAMIAAKQFDNISVVDTKNVCHGQALLVMRALELVKKGLDRKTVVDILEEEKKKIRFYAIVDTLKYLEKGGRLSKGAAIVGGLIGIKPILAIEDGLLVAKEKARGSKSAYSRMADIVKNDNVDTDRPIIMAYSGTTDHKLQIFKNDNSAKLERIMPGVIEKQIGTAVGTHAGPGTVVVTYFVK